ncbi:MAG: 23S rRNA (pseudouridine(1915)-N(3))-methyltransferase RlmH [Steroidobacteraceae bacterium]
MRVRLLAIGQRLPAWAQAAVDDYSMRLGHYCRFEVRAFVAAARGRGRSDQQAMANESERLLAALKPGEKLIALDERGRQFRSLELASWLESQQAAAMDLAFAIGGADGFSDELRQRAGMLWSLSAGTLPHALARVVAIEQLYRAFTLLAGHPYHRQ